MAAARGCIDQMRQLPAAKGDQTGNMKRRNPEWSEEINAQLRKATAHPRPSVAG
jgi:hypothetical protein